jgi:serine/threonine-protein kinase RsbW
MENDLVTASSLGFSGKIVKLTPKGSERDSDFLPELLRTFENCFKQNILFYILDLRFLKELPPSTIVLLLEMTARARRQGGELYITNISRLARNNLLSFNPSSYLTTSSDEESAIMECEDRIHFEKSQYYHRQSTSANFSRPTAFFLKPDSIQIPSRVDSLYKACNFVVDFAKNMGFPQSELGKIKIAVYEACLNVIEHAYHSDPSQVVKVDVEQAADKLIISVIDHGSGFEVNSYDFDILDAVMRRSTGGMGLHIIRRSMDEVNYSQDPLLGNRLMMVKYLSTATKQPDYALRTNIKSR